MINSVRKQSHTKIDLIWMDDSNLPCINIGKQTKGDRVNKNSFSTFKVAIFSSILRIIHIPHSDFPHVFSINCHPYIPWTLTRHSVWISVRWRVIIYTPSTRNWIHDVSLSSSLSSIKLKAGQSNRNTFQKKLLSFKFEVLTLKLPKSCPCIPIEMPSTRTLVKIQDSRFYCPYNIKKFVFHWCNM